MLWERKQVQQQRYHSVNHRCHIKTVATEWLQQIDIKKKKTQIKLGKTGRLKPFCLAVGFHYHWY